MIVLWPICEVVIVSFVIAKASAMWIESAIANNHASMNWTSIESESEIEIENVIGTDERVAYVHSMMNVIEIVSQISTVVIYPLIAVEGKNVIAIATVIVNVIFLIMTIWLMSTVAYQSLLAVVVLLL